jgi:hypothetical protein
MGVVRWCGRLGRPAYHVCYATVVLPLATVIILHGS